MKSVLLLLVILSCVSCVKEEMKGPKQTGYKEYTMTVASDKRIGLSGQTAQILCDVYAVKTDNATAWSSFVPTPLGFNYEPGYEYVIQVAETNWIDYDRGDPAYTDYALKKVISKTKKESEGLPKHFIPDWFIPQNEIHIRYAIEADNKEIIEKDIKADSSIPWNCKLELFNFYALYNSENKLIDCGSVRELAKDLTLFPEVYKKLPIEGTVSTQGEFVFISSINQNEGERHSDAFIKVLYGATLTPVAIYLYKDFTAYYKQKYPEAKVDAVVVSFTIEFGKH